MNKVKCLFLIILISLIFSGCSNVGSSEKMEAEKVIQSYLSYIINGDFEKAYDLLSDYDKENFSKELYIEARKEISKVIKFSNVEMDSTIDSFKNYSYNGMRFDKAISIKVSLAQESLLKGYKPDDKTTYRQMAVLQNNSWRIGLFVTKDKLEESIEKYKKLQ